jgi:glutaredoxin
MGLARAESGPRPGAALALLGTLLALGCDAGLEHLAAATGSASAGSGVESLEDEASARRVYYQFVDDRGRVHFVERLEAVPAAWRATMGYVELDVPPPLSPLEARLARDARGVRTGRAASAAPGATNVVLYSAEWCGACRKAKRHLDSRDVRYELRDVDDPRHLESLVETTGRKGIPVLLVDGRVVSGFNAARYDELLRL